MGNVLQARKYKALIIFTLILMLCVSYITNRLILIALPSPLWGWSLMCCLITGSLYVFHHRYSRLDWLFYTLFIFFFGVFLGDFESFIEFTTAAIESRLVLLLLS